MHLARATASFGLKARAARRRRSFARTKSPSCAIAMPRRARAGASLRSATRFNAPRGSPAARARAAAVISESMRVPPHLSLPPLRGSALNIAHGHQRMGHRERNEQRHSTKGDDMNMENKTILITGANRGIGRALVDEALRRGAKKVYAGTRSELRIADQRVTPLSLDVTDAAQVQQAVEQIDSLDVLINNAGIAI